MDMTGSLILNILQVIGAYTVAYWLGKRIRAIWWAMSQPKADCDCNWHKEQREGK